MPSRLPVKDLVNGLTRNIYRAVRYWFHYTLVALAWLGVVPITACKFEILSFHWEIKLITLDNRHHCVYNHENMLI